MILAISEGADRWKLIVGREWPRVPNRTDAREPSAWTRAPQAAVRAVDGNLVEARVSGGLVADRARDS